MKRSTPLKRTGAIKRKTPIKSKRSTPRTTKSSPCHSRGCKAIHAPIRVTPEERYCNKHGTKRADDLCSAFVKARDPRCVACGRSDEGVQWAHVHTRGMRYIRWDALNSVGLCARCHFAYTKRPAAWVKFVERTWPGLFVRLLWRELYGDSVGSSVDVGLVIRTYREGAAWYWADPPPLWAPADQGVGPEEDVGVG